jgi:N-acetylmuramoyl-L-alanine amidase CwlA
VNVVFKRANASNFKTGRTDSIKYIVIHYTANNGDTAKNNADYYASNKVEASAHYFVDEYDTVYQSVKDSDTAWAVGASKYVHPYCRNANSISIELCSRNPNGKVSANNQGWYFKPETIINAVNLTKELMVKYGIPTENVIRHYDVTGKICPAPFVNNIIEWENFKKMLMANKYSYDDTVNNMILDGITTVDNMQYWEKVLDGREKIDLNNLRTILNRYHEKTGA